MTVHSVPDVSHLEDMFRLAVERQRCLKPQSAASRPRILFLGNSYNRSSAACLQALVESGYDTVVGFYDPLTKGTWRLVRNRLRSRGWGPVLHKAVDLARCKARIALRKVGFPPSGFFSLPELSRTLGLKTIGCQDPNGAEFVEQVRRLQVDLVVVANFTRILKKELIAVPRIGCINVHPSLLPRYRGPEPNYWVLANGEKTTGVTLHYVDEGIDSGDIILQRAFPIAPKDTEFTLRNRSAQVAAELLRDAIPLLLGGKAQRIRQDDSLASYYSFPPKGRSIRQRIQRARSVPTGLSEENAPAPVEAALHTLDPLQDPRWREFVDEHPRAAVFHSVAWLDALRRTYGYQPVVFTTSPPGARLQNGVVFCRVDSAITGRRLVSLPFSDHCEPLVDRAEDFKRIALHIQSSVASEGYKYAELRPASDRPAISPAHERFQTSKSHYLHVVDLRPQEEELLRRFHESSVQRRIRRAIREGLVYESGRSHVLLKTFYDLLVLTRRRHHLPPQPEKWFRNLIACFGDAIEIHTASHDGIPVAAILTLSFRDTVTYKYGGTDPAYKRFGSMPFLLWRAIQAAKSKGASVLDLGRSDHDDDGLIAFKDHWAAVRTELVYWRFPVSAQGFMRNGAPGLTLAQHAIGCLPPSALKLAGQLLYRHMG